MVVTGARCPDRYLREMPPHDAHDGDLNSDTIASEPRFFLVTTGRPNLAREIENDDREIHVRCPCVNEYSTFVIQECGPISRHSNVVSGKVNS